MSKMHEALQYLKVIRLSDGCFGIVNKFSNEIIKRDFKTRQKANAYIFTKYGGGEKDHERRERWWNGHPRFHFNVMRIIKYLHEHDADHTLSMLDAFHATQKLAIKLGVMDYTIKEWNHLAHSRGKLSDWVEDNYDELYASGKHPLQQTA